MTKIFKKPEFLTSNSTLESGYTLDASQGDQFFDSDIEIPQHRHPQRQTFDSISYSIFLNSLKPHITKPIILSSSLSSPLLGESNGAPLSSTPFLHEIKELCFLSGWAYPNEYPLSKFLLFMRYLIFIGTTADFLRDLVPIFFLPKSPKYYTKANPFITPSYIIIVFLIHYLPLFQGWLVLVKYPFFQAYTKVHAFISDEDNIDLSTQLPFSLKQSIKKSQRLSTFLTAVGTILNILQILVALIAAGIPWYYLILVAILGTIAVPSVLSIWCIFFIYCYNLTLLVSKLTNIAKNLDLTSETAEEELSLLEQKYATMYNYLFHWSNLWTPLLLIVINMFFQYLLQFTDSCPKYLIESVSILIAFILALAAFPSQISSQCSQFQEAVCLLNQRAVFSPLKLQNQISRFNLSVTTSSQTFGYLIFGFKFTTAHIGTILVFLYSFTGLYFSFIYKENNLKCLPSS